MKAENPKNIRLIEVGPRDGFQMESRRIPTDLKAEIIKGLISAGIREIQVASFVHPKKVPQMADAERLIPMLPENDQVRFTGLALNLRGVERAHQAGLRAVEVSISASDTHGRKNAGISFAEALELGKAMARKAKFFRMHTIASIQCSFGCVYENEVSLEHVRRAASVFLAEGADRLNLADTTGMAHPKAVRERVAAVTADAGGIPVGLHLHDTRGLGLVNLMTGLECGVRHFDASFGGMGGCPFVKGAAGNIPTEDTVYLLEKLGMETGIDRMRVAEISRKMSAFLQKDLPGKLYRLETGCDSKHNHG